MQLLKLRLKNLNSLAGEWEIDFTDPAFAAESLYIITGPTGAGKTTVLDAVCLALYGQTPRLGLVTKGNNEIMSRQRGDCLAEVTFETKGRKYRASFKQHRAGYKPGAALQSPFQELVREDTRQVLETRAREKNDLVAELIGLDFPRFTRSILLAQGSFAAFLASSSKERGPILEAITGTEIYSRISAQVFEKAKAEKEALSLISRDLDSLAILDEAEIEALNRAIMTLSQEEKNLEAGREAGQTALNRLFKIKNLQGETQELGRNLAELNNDISAFRPEAERLARARVALELEGPYSRLANLRAAQKNDHDSLAKAEKNIITLTESLELEVRNLQSAERLLEQKENNRLKALPQLEEVKKLDLSIQNQNELMAGQNEAAQKLIHKHKALTKTVADLQNKELKLTGEQALNFSRIEEHKSDGTLAEALPALGRDKEDLDNLKADRESLQKELARSRDALAKITRNIEIWSQEEAVRRRHYEGLQSQRDAKSAAKDSLLSPGRSFWREKESQLRARVLRLNDGLKEEAFIRTLEASINEKTARQSEISLITAQDGCRLSALAELRPQAEKNLELSEQNLALAQSAASLEDRRAQLTPGQPCPLCGSLDHPFASVTLPSASETALAVKKSKAELRRLDQENTALLKSQAALNEEHRLLTKTLDKENGDLKIRLADLENLIAGVSSFPPAEARPEAKEILNSSLLAETNELSKIEGIYQKAEALDAELAADQAKTEKIQAGLADMQQKITDARQSQAKFLGEADRLNRDTENKTRSLTEKWADLRDKLTLFGYEIKPETEPASVLTDLLRRKNEWQNLIETRDSLKMDLALTKEALDRERPGLALVYKELDESQALGRNMAEKLNQLLRSRQELLGDLDPQTELKRLDKEVRTAEADRKKAEELYRENEKNLSLGRAKKEELQKALEERAPLLAEGERAFKLSLSNSSLTGEETFLGARLSSPEREKLDSAQRHLDNEKTRISSLLDNKSRELEQEKAKNLTSEDEASLAELLEKTKTALKEIRQTIGAHQHKLAENDRLRDEKAEKIKAFEKQRAKLCRVEKLNSLIGQADGRKFREYAQSLTFEYLVQKANRQLAKMSGRYLLCQDKEHILEFNVMDNFQAGEIRSTKNLSGGESFLVSLALALGLSMMASENVEVNSLFLDEGFGTLDEDALDMALSALGQLPQSEGKTIGLISHVEALKERISTQIKIVPRPGGQSLLTGPGCRRLNSA